MKFKKGMKCVITNPVYNHYKKGQNFILKTRVLGSDSDDDENKWYYWTTTLGGTGIAEKEMEPCTINWRERLEK